MFLLPTRIPPMTLPSSNGLRTVWQGPRGRREFLRRSLKPPGSCPTTRGATRHCRLLCQCKSFWRSRTMTSRAIRTSTPCSSGWGERFLPVRRGYGVLCCGGGTGFAPAREKGPPDYGCDSSDYRGGWPEGHRADARCGRGASIHGGGSGGQASSSRGIAGA